MNPSMTTWPCAEVDAGVHQDCSADAHLRGDHRQPMRDPWEHGNSERIETRLGAVERLGEECVTRPHQAQDLAHSVSASAELRAFAHGPRP